MAYATVDSVAGMYPAFVRGESDQAPSDALIGTYIDDVAAELDAILQRRFGEAITEAGGFTAWQAALSAEAQDLLEKLNRYGAAEEMGEVFASLGNKSAAALATSYAKRWQEMSAELNAEYPDGKPKAQGGRYDKMFDSQARTVGPRAQFGGVAGGEMPDDETAEDEGLSNYFEKFGDRQE